MGWILTSGDSVYFALSLSAMYPTRMQGIFAVLVCIPLNDLQRAKTREGQYLLAVSRHSPGKSSRVTVKTVRMVVYRQDWSTRQSSPREKAHAQA